MTPIEMRYHRLFAKLHFFHAIRTEMVRPTIVTYFSLYMLFARCFSDFTQTNWFDIEIETRDVVIISCNCR